MAMKPEQYRLLRKRYTHLLELQSTEWQDHWLDLADYILPRHGRFPNRRKTQPGRGDKSRHGKIINGTASRAKSIAVAGIRGGLIPHSLPWFKVGLWDEDLAKWGPAKEHLHTCQSIVYSMFSRSNFYSASSTLFSEQITFGVGPMAMYADAEKSLHCTPWTVGEYVLANNEKGVVDTGFRRYDMSVRAAEARFGLENLRPETQNKFKTSPDAYIGVINCIMPRRDYDPNGGNMAANLPWASLYWEEGCTEQDGLLGESGFSTKPVFFPRWDVLGEDVYGSNCPGMECLADIKMLQKLEKDKLLGIEHGTNPAMNIPSSMKGRLSWLPGTRNDVSATQDSVIRPTLKGVDFNISDIREEIRAVEQRIKEGFFNDLFLMIINDPSAKTAYEVARKHEEKLSILGPTIERQDSEFLSPAFDRVWDIALRGGMFPPPPPELRGKEIRVEYVSLLAQAQKAIGTQSYERVADFAARLASTVNIEAADKIDCDAMIDGYGILVGVDPAGINSAEEVKEIRDRRAEDARKQAQMEQMAAASQMASNLGKAQTTEDTALGGLLGTAV